MWEFYTTRRSWGWRVCGHEASWGYEKSIGAFVGTRIGFLICGIFGLGFCGAVEVGGDFFGEAEADAGDFGNLGGWDFAEAVNRAEALEEGAFAGFGDARDVVEEAFFHAAFEEEAVVGIGKAVGFVADALE